MAPVVALAAGGSAGHVHRALAIADAYAALRPGVRCLFIGTRGGIEARLLAAAQREFVAVDAGPVSTVGALAGLASGARLVSGARQARATLRGCGAELVVGLGGYASVPGVLAAFSLGLPVALHEANASPGRANRLLARVAQRVYLGSRDAQPAFGAAVCAYVGNPIRAGVARVRDERRSRARPHEPARIVVLGGSLGSPRLDAAAPEVLAAVARTGIALDIRHQIGAGEGADIERRYAECGLRADVRGFIDDIADAYRWADVAITSAGAVTLSELATCGLPALLVPLARAAGQHQAANAAAFAERTGVACVEEDRFRAPLVAPILARLLGEPAEWAAQAARLREHAEPDDAAGAVVRGCEVLRLAHRQHRAEGDARRSAER